MNSGISQCLRCRNVSYDREVKGYFRLLAVCLLGKCISFQTLTFLVKKNNFQKVDPVVLNCASLLRVQGVLGSVCLGQAASCSHTQGPRAPGLSLGEWILLVSVPLQKAETPVYVQSEYYRVSQSAGLR